MPVRGHAIACLALAGTLAACSSGSDAAATSTCEKDASAGACADGGEGEGSPVVKPPSSVDGGVSAPCVDSTNCAAGLTCLDGACFG
jgi:hypothetical protein